VPFDKYGAVNMKLLRKLTMLLYVMGIHTMNNYNKYLFNLVSVGETIRHERITME